MRQAKVVLVTVVVMLGVTALVPLLGVVAYSDAMKLTAPFLCPDDLPDARVEEYTESDFEGESTNYSMFCVNDDGGSKEIGALRPYLVLAAYTFGILLVLLVIGLLVIRATKGRRGGSDEPPESEGPAPTAAPPSPPSTAAPKDASAPSN